MTWRWVIKDKQRRESPLVPELAQLLVDIQTALSEEQLQANGHSAKILARTWQSPLKTVKRAQKKRCQPKHN